MQKYTFAELIQFQHNPAINPTTKRKIKQGSKIYKNLKLQLDRMHLMNQNASFIQQRQRYLQYRSIQTTLKASECINSHDPISLEPIGKISSSCLSTISINGVVFGYHIESIVKLVENNTVVCPMTRSPIPKKTLKTLRRLVKAYKSVVTPVHQQKSMARMVEAMTKDVFHEFTLESIYLDHTVFLGLKMWQLKNLHYEWMDMFEKNTTLDQKQRILGDAVVFQSIDFTQFNKLQYQHYLLQQAIKILRPCDPSLKTLTTFIMLGGLTLVCPQYAQYRMYAFEF